MQKNQLINIEEHFERYCSMLPVFEVNSAKNYLNLFKYYSLPILGNGRDIEVTVIKTANQFVSFKLGGIQLLDTLIFVGGATSLKFFVRPHKINDTKRFFPFEWLGCKEKLSKKYFLRKNLSLTFCATVTTLKKPWTILKTLFRVAYLESKH